jgi:hypothetical protein
MPLKEINPKVEIKRPISLRGDHSCVHQQIIVTLVQHTKITLRLASNLFHWAVGQSCLIQERKVVINNHALVNPRPFVAVAI